MNYCNVLTTQPGYNFILERIEIDPNKRATITYQYRTPEGIENAKLIVDGLEYKQWGTNDDFILDKVCAHHGLTRMIVPEPEFITELIYVKLENGTYEERAIQVPNPAYIPPSSSS